MGRERIITRRRASRWALEDRRLRWEEGCSREEDREALPRWVSVDRVGDGEREDEEGREEAIMGQAESSLRLPRPRMVSVSVLV